MVLKVRGLDKAAILLLERRIVRYKGANRCVQTSAEGLS